MMIIIQYRYISPNIIHVIKSRRMGWDGHVALMGEINSYYVLVGKLERKRPLGKTRHRWEDNIRMDLMEIGCGLGCMWLRTETIGGPF
jgi:hypothetical protein